MIRKRGLALFAIWLLLFSLLPGTVLATEAKVPAPPFWDIIGSPYQEPVGRLYGLGLVSGLGEREFGVAAAVTRAQMAAFAVRALNADQGASLVPAQFPDVSKAHWAYDVITRAATAGIIRGSTDGRFYPENVVTQGEAVAMLIRMLGYESTIEGEWPAGHLLKAREIGLLQSVTGFSFAAPASRGLIALLLDNSVFRVPYRGTQLTLSQGIHQKALSLSIEPTGGALGSGVTQLRAMGLDYVGRELSLGQVTWRIVSGPAQVTSDGKLVIQGTQAVTVQASVGDLTAFAAYDVASELRVSAQQPFAKPGESVQLQAEGITAAGKSIAVQPEWKVTSGSGQVTTNGLLTVSGDGPVVVSATVGSLSGSVTVTGVSGLQISPSGATVTSGESMLFTAAYAGSAGSAPVQWSVKSGPGSIDANGRFTAGNGNALIQAMAGDVTATVGVQVVTKIEVSPATANVSTGGTQQFTAVGKANDGSVVPINVTWSVPSSMGIIDSTGRFVGTGSGSGSVTATYRVLKGTATLAVAGPAASIQVTIDKNTMVANGKSQATITAMAVDSYGNRAMSQTGNVLFTLDSGTKGSLNRTEATLVDGAATVTFTSSTASGTVRIYGSLPGTSVASGYLDITTTAPAASRIELRPFPTTIAAAAGSRTTITAFLVDQDGQAMNNNTGVVLTVNIVKTGVGGTLSSTAATINSGASSGDVVFYSDGTEGSVTFAGSAVYTVQAATVQTIPVGAAQKLAILPPTATAADGSATMTVKVAIQDANGVGRTQDSDILITLNARVNNATAAGFPKQAVTAGGVATFTIQTTVAGTWDLAATGASLLAATAAAEFTAGTPYKLDLTAVPMLGLGNVSYISADAGQSTIKLRARVLDINNNVVPSASHEITFSKTTNNSVTELPATTKATAVSGIAELSITSTAKTGSDVYVASAANLLNSTAFTVTSRVTGIPAKLRVQNIATARVGDKVTVTVQVQDIAGNAVTGANSTIVSLYSTSTTANLDGPKTAVAGVATFSITDTKAGTLTITATADGVSADTVGQNFTLVAAPPDHIQLTAVPDTLPADGTSQSLISAAVVDAYGNAASGSSSITLSVEGAATLVSSSMSTGGTATVKSTTSPGTITVKGVASSGVYVKPVTLTSSIPGTPSRVVVEEVAPSAAGTANPITLRLKILDSNGNVAANLNSGSSVSYMGATISGMSSAGSLTITNAGSTGLIDKGYVPNGTSQGAAVVVNGVGTLTLTNTKAETLTVTPVLFYMGTALTAEPRQLTTVAGPVSTLTIEPVVPVLSTTVGSTKTITAKLTDQYGNVVPQVGETVEFTFSGNTYVMYPANTVVAADSGMASITVTSVVHPTGGATTMMARSTKTGKSTTTTITTDTPPAKPIVFASSTAGGNTVAAGGHLRVQMTVQRRNAVQNLFVYVNGILVTLRESPGGVTAVNSIAAGNTGLTAYVNYSDLGSVGAKSVTVLMINDLGTSPVSDSASFTLQ